jgi:hypothetical protein
LENLLELHGKNKTIKYLLLAQVSGCVGVPLYRIYPRKTEWVRERKREDKREEGLHRLQKRDSVDDLIDQVGKQYTATQRES